MKYMGGKFRIRKEVALFLNNARKNGQIYIEPFVGGGNIVSEIDTSKGINIAFGVHKGLIKLYNSVKDGINLPDEISEIEYKLLKEKNDYNDPLTAFAGFGCSFSGKYFGGYARSKDTKRNYALENKKNILNQLNNIKQFEFLCGSFEQIKPFRAFIYCDAPYINTTSYKDTPTFDYIKYYAWLREISIDNDVYISEYSMPDDFNVVYEIKTKTDMNTKNGKSERIEKIFKFRGHHEPI